MVSALNQLEWQFIPSRQTVSTKESCQVLPGLQSDTELYQVYCNKMPPTTRHVARSYILYNTRFVSLFFQSVSLPWAIWKPLPCHSSLSSLVTVVSPRPLAFLSAPLYYINHKPRKPYSRNILPPPTPPQYRHARASEHAKTNGADNSHKTGKYNHKQDPRTAQHGILYPTSCPDPPIRSPPPDGDKDRKI